VTEHARLSARIAAIAESATLKVDAKAKALQAEGRPVISYAAGEPDFPTPEHIVEAALAAVRDPRNHRYTPAAGLPDLREAIAQKTLRDSGLEVGAGQVVVTNGGKQALYNCFQALLSDGDEVVMFAPYWVSYPEQVLLAGGRPVVVPTRVEEGFQPDPDLLAKAITPRTRAVIFNSPSNPTGAVLPKENLLELAAVLAVHPDLLVITDDIYERLLYTGHRFVNVANVAPTLRNRTLVVNGMSKAFAMTGWRMGYAAGPKALISGMQLVQDQSTSNVNSLTQRAALAALTGPQEPIEAMVREFHQRRDLFYTGLTQIPGVRCAKPEGAFYAFPDVSAWIGRSWKGKTLGSAHDISERLLEDLLVAAVPGEPFGAPGHLRFSFAAGRATLEKGLQRLRDFAAALS